MPFKRSMVGGRIRKAALDCLPLHFTKHKPIIWPIEIKSLLFKGYFCYSLQFSWVDFLREQLRAHNNHPNSHSLPSPKKRMHLEEVIMNVSAGKIPSSKIFLIMYLMWSFSLYVTVCMFLSGRFWTCFNIREINEIIH